MRFLGVLWILAIVAYGLVFLAASISGLGHFIPWWLAAVVFVLCMMFRFHLPLVVAAFLGAWLVFEWHWLLALFLAAPGIVLMIPALAVELLGATGRTIQRRRLLR